MMQEDKRVASLSPGDVQRGNKSWWTTHTMSYDWHGQLNVEPYTQEWFDRIDANFLSGARLFATDRRPFDLIMPLDSLAGARVLEIGCGMGLHTETMIRAGAEVTAIDLSPTSIMATTKRLALKGLSGTVLEHDAENLPFESESFDFVWSWGVIHHSARTALIAREIARVLAPKGECRIMVYNRDGMPARIAFVVNYLLKGGFLSRSYEEELYRTTDGFSARYYTAEQFEDLFRAFFRDVSVNVCGQEADAVPLPRALRKLVLRAIPEQRIKLAQAQRGGFLFLKASAPF